MFTQNEYVMIRLNNEAYNNARREAEKVRMLRSAGLIQPSGLHRITCRGAGQLGRALVALGQRLVKVEAAAAGS